MPVFQNSPGLLPRFRAGERAALEAVYWAYLEKVERIVRHGFVLPDGQGRMTGIRGRPEDLADLVQESFLKAFAPAARAAFDGLREYGPYLYTITRNVMVDWARRQGREPPTVPVDLERIAEEGAGGLPGQDDPAGLLQPGELDLVRAYVGSLSPELRAVHQARYERGLSQRAAAEVLGITRPVLRTLEGRLRKGLVRAMKRAALGARLSA